MNRISSPQSICHFGIAREDITPPVGIYHRMWGAASHDQSEGVHRPLVATATYFRSTAEPSHQDQLLIAIDHCLLGYEEVEMLLRTITAKTSMDREHISLTFSHTHGAGLLNMDRESFPGGELIPAYLEQLATTLAEISAAAIADTTPVNITYGVGRCNLAANRDYFDPQLQQYVCGFNPGHSADDTVVVARVSDANRQLLCTFVNYACHPTTLAWDNRLISPDYPGAMREVVERETGKPCVFLQGASGDLGPVHGFVGDTEVCDRNGRQLGYAVLSTLETLSPPGTAFQYAGAVVSGATIGTWQSVPLDSQDELRLREWQWDGNRIALPYRADLPDTATVEAEYRQLVLDEREQQALGESEKAADSRALAERKKRMLGRLQCLPPGKSFPHQATAWRIGDAIVWVLFNFTGHANGSLYQ
ncbi:MAG: hypothetical protein CL681_00740, partial [Blastopirellula sp.]|nr:hypothetical protein [Blastopirellula sp.]